MANIFTAPKKRGDYLITELIEEVDGKRYGQQSVAEWIPKGTCITSALYIFEKDNPYYEVQSNGFFAITKKDGFYGKIPVFENKEDLELPWSMPRCKLVYLGADISWQELPKAPGYDGNQNDYAQFCENTTDKKTAENIVEEDPVKETADIGIYDIQGNRTSFKKMMNNAKEILKDAGDLSFVDESTILISCCYSHNIKVIANVMAEYGITTKSATETVVMVLCKLKDTYPHLQKEIKDIHKAYMWQEDPSLDILPADSLTDISLKHVLYQRIYRLIQMILLDAPKPVIENQCSLTVVAYARIITANMDKEKGDRSC